MFGDGEALAAIISARKPAVMKAIGRRVLGFDAAHWERRRSAIVKTGNHAKFKQNPDLLNYLAGTGDRIIVEAAPRDAIWGIGLPVNSPDAENPLQWPGLNLLGFALTEIRDRLAATPS